MSIKHILLTGSNGMVGKNFKEHSKSGNFAITAPSRSDLDLQDFQAVLSFIDKIKPDVVVHAAGKVGGIQANIRTPADFLLDNIQIGCNVVKASREIGVTKLLNLGSSCMYPRGYDEPLDEGLLMSGELEPTNEGYALAKIAVMKLCEYISREDTNYKYKTVLPCNLYGRHDKFSPSESHLLPSIIRKLHYAKINNVKTVEIWGNGMAKREFMYAGDFADAIVRFIEKFDVSPELMNLGLGFDYTINEYYKTAAEVIGFKGNFYHDLTKPVGMNRKLLNITRQLEWGWRPQATLQEGIEKTYSFFLENNPK